MALSITLAVVIFAPLIFIKGKHAKLVPGTVFDAVVRQATDVKFDGPRKVEPDLGTDPLTIEILYDDIQFTKKNKVEYLPMLITRCDGPIHDAAITAVNGTGIPAIPLSIIGRDVGETDDGCNLARVNADFREFGKQLRPGLNRFTVRTGEQSKEVLLEIEF